MASGWNLWVWLQCIGVVSGPILIVRDSVLSSDARLHVNPVHFLVRRAVC